MITFHQIQIFPVRGFEYLTLRIANSQEGMLSIALLKAFVALNGKAGVKEKAEKLFARIKKSVDQGKITRQDKYADTLQIIWQLTMERYFFAQ
ncbi:MAG: hypothetical protein KA981_01690 [Bacteroidia bacterium]|nr:hypothetical protein [Bacteroidia bacterium]